MRARRSFPRTVVVRASAEYVPKGEYDPPSPMGTGH